MGFQICNCKGISVCEGIFGEIWPDGFGDEINIDEVPKIIKSYTLINNNRMEVTLINWGATIISIKCPDKFGRCSDVVLGFDDIKGYMNPHQNPFIGCILGRCANRIKDGCFTLKGKDYRLTLNDLKMRHHLHGGTNGFGRRVWESYISGCSVVMSYLSADMEEGYPGATLSTIRFKLMSDNKLEISMRATTSKPTVLNLSHGSMFNLAGHDAGSVELKEHKVMLNCDRWTFAEYLDPIPTGSIRGVTGTIMDLRIPRLLRDYMEKVPPGEGYDHNFCVTKNWEAGNQFVSKVWHECSGRYKVLEVYSDQPGLQFYTGGRLPSHLSSEVSPSYDSLIQKDVAQIEGSEHYNEEEEGNEWDDLSHKSEPLEFISGKGGARYQKHCAFSIQPQNYPNAINYSHFPCSILYPGQVYCHDLAYKFGVQFANYM